MELLDRRRVAVRRRGRADVTETLTQRVAGAGTLVHAAYGAKFLEVISVINRCGIQFVERDDQPPIAVARSLLRAAVEGHVVHDARLARFT